MAIPKIPVSQHQKMAPGPPKATAVETPIMFPVPKVAASVVERAAKGDTPDFLATVVSESKDTLSETL